MKLSVLDQSPISKGNTAVHSLHQTIELAKWTENLGYHRYWVAEHHNTNGLAGSSPEVLIGRIAALTESIRVGSGGVLLPQYSPLKVAEQFRMLEAFYPGRIDLGLGRSPGGGKKTRLALTDGQEKSLSSFQRQVKELIYFLNDEVPKGHDYYGVHARPETNSQPEPWILGLTERGAKHAAVSGTGFTFGHFINPDQAEKAYHAYRDRFKASTLIQEPKTNAAIFVVCAETEEEANELALSQDLWLLQVEKGLETRVPSIEEYKARSFSETEKEKMKMNRRRCVIGTPLQVKKQLRELSIKYGTSEFLIITNIFDFEKKKTSYKLIADVFKPS